MTTPADTSSDVVIVGAGPAGLALSVALSQAGLRCTVLEQAPLESLAHPHEDGRDIALTHRSRRILNQLGIWSLMPEDDTAPLRQAMVRNGASSRLLPFDARADGHEQLGWLVPNHRIREACFAAAQQAPNVTLVGDARVTGLNRTAEHASVSLADDRSWQAPLVVAADSRFSNVRRWAGIPARSLDFGRTAIVCRMEHELEHSGVAYECFRYGNTLAILPMSGRQCSAVLTVRNADAAEWLAMEPAAFADRVASQFDRALGGMTLTGERHAYPLVAVYAQRFADARFALVGDAAVGMHPVTAHGYNFGLYGVATLTEALARARREGQDLGDAKLLEGYSDAHLRATLPIYAGTNFVVQLFTNEQPAARVAREAVLRVAGLLPPVQRAITRQLTGDAMLPGWPQWLPEPPKLPGFLARMPLWHNHKPA